MIEARKMFGNPEGGEGTLLEAVYKGLVKKHATEKI
jgi:hypothetical protein